MSIKKIITILLILFITANSTFAANWLPIQANNGKIAEINLDNLAKNGNTITYEIRQTKQDRDIIYTMRTNYTNKTTAIIKMKIYKDNKQVGFEDFSKILKYNQIKVGTLNDSVYQFLLLVREAPALRIDPKIWDKYFKKQQCKIQKNWHPTIISASEYPDKKAIVYVTLMLDKQGNIIYKNYQSIPEANVQHKEFDKKLELAIGSALRKIQKFPPLPQEYKGDKIIIIMKFEYSCVGGAKPKAIKFNDIGVGYLEFGKNYSTLVWLGEVLSLPLLLLYWIFIEPFRSNSNSLN